MPDFEKDYWDLVQVATTADGVYCDWEGFTSPDDLRYATDHLSELMRGGIDSYGPTYARMIADLTLHWVHENVDQAGYHPSEHEIETVFYAFFSLFVGRYHMKSEFDYDQGKEVNNG